MDPSGQLSAAAHSGGKAQITQVATRPSTKIIPRLSVTKDFKSDPVVGAINLVH